MPQATVADLKEKACKAVGAEEVDVRMWEYFQGTQTSNLEESLDKRLREFNKIFAVMLEQKVSLGS